MFQISSGTTQPIAGNSLLILQRTTSLILWCPATGIMFQKTASWLRRYYLFSFSFYLLLSISACLATCSLPSLPSPSVPFCCLTSVQGSAKVLQFHERSLVKALLSLFPDIGLSPQAFPSTAHHSKPLPRPPPSPPPPLSQQ